jgi:hypothetical protein
VTHDDALPALSDDEIRDAYRLEFDRLMDHVYEYGTVAEGTEALALKFARAVEQRVLAPLAARAPAVNDARLSRAIDCLQILAARPRPLCRDCADADGVCPTTGLDCDLPRLMADARAALAARGEEPQRPIAWMMMHGVLPMPWATTDEPTAIRWRKAGADVRPLYAAPPPAADASDYTCRSDGRCQYAIDHGAAGLGHCPVGKCAMRPAADAVSVDGRKVTYYCDAKGAT